MSLLFTILEGFMSLWKWISGNKDKQLGKEEQENADAAETIKRQDAELAAAVQPHDAVNSLHRHDI